jgi:hypothetical protein
MKKLIFAISLVFASACGGADGAMGPTGPAGKDAVVDYDAIYKTVDQKLPPLVEAAVSNIALPELNTDSIVARVVAQVPAGPAGPQGIQGIQGEKGEKGDPGVSTGIGFNANGDIIMPMGSRLCWIQCVDEQGEQIQILGNGAGILYVSNWDGTWFQSPDKQWATAGMSPDGGWRISQNQLWTKYGVHKSWINPKPHSTVGFDSRGMWSMLTRGVGDTGGGQDLVFNINRGNGVVDLTTWQPGVRLRLCQTPAGAPYSDATDCR